MYTPGKPADHTVSAILYTHTASIAIVYVGLRLCCKSLLNFIMLRSMAEIPFMMIWKSCKSTGNCHLHNNRLRNYGNVM